MIILYLKLLVIPFRRVYTCCHTPTENIPLQNNCITAYSLVKLLRSYILSEVIFFLNIQINASHRLIKGQEQERYFALSTIQLSVTETLTFIINCF